jgi:peptidoglycan/xylan/chitin deacetylase (PgdA/CDA1 family)
MAVNAPQNFHTLKPFLGLFQDGVPVLMYHKIGQRPRRVRLKGLYVTPKVFVRQLGEFRDGGFTTCAPTHATATPPAGSRVVFTFDDGFRNVFENALEPLVQHRFHAIQFLVANLLGKTNEWEQREGESPEPLMDVVQVREWLAAGHDIGSHSLTHPRLARLTLRDAREEIFASKKKLEDTFGRAIEHFCYPYGDWNDGVRDLVMEAGYRTACTTLYGVNSSTTSPFALHRITVRHPTRSLKALKARLMG